MLHKIGVGRRVRSRLDSTKGKWGERASIRKPDWIFRANIEHFRKLLETEKDPKKRAMIESELAEEEAKLAALNQPKGDRKKN